MSFAKLPDGMLHYATYELAEKLAKLSVQQRRGIDEIVKRHIIGGEPLAALFRGDDKICTDTNYYKRGYIDEGTGELRKAGWAHQPDFTDALAEATRLALQTEQRENVRKLQKAKQVAVDNAENAVKVLLNVMTFDWNGSSRVSAADKVLGLATKEAESVNEQSSGQGSEAADWWAVADE